MFKNRRTCCSKLSLTYVQEQKNMLVVMKEVRFKIILRTAVITTILKI